MMINGPLILIDGSSYFFRAFHALPPLTNSKGMPTGAIYGVANMVKRLMKDHQTSHMAVIFDAKGKTFREDLFPAYKAHRAAMPDELFCQFTPLTQILKAMGLPLLIIEGVEADDVIGTLAAQATAKGIPVLISTSDKDMAQLVNEHITLINTMSGQILDIEGVRNKFGVLPQQMIDYLSLIGDTVDNVPGVYKCGPKTAVKWLSEYQSLEKIMEKADLITGKIGEHLRTSLAHLPLSKQLVTIKTDVDLPVELEDLSIQAADRNKLIELARELEFKNWLKELLDVSNDNDAENSPQIEAHKYKIIYEHTDLDKLVSALHHCSIFAFNLECDELACNNQSIVGIAIALDHEDLYYIPLLHQTNDRQLAFETVLQALKPIFENERIAKIGYNLKNAYHFLNNNQIQLRAIEADLMLMSYVLSSTANHDIESLSLKYLGHKSLGREELTGKGSKQIDFSSLPISKAAFFATEQVRLYMMLKQVLDGLLTDSLKNILRTIEIPLLSVLADIEKNGVLIDEPTLREHGQRLKQRIAALEMEAIELAQRPFNLNSPKQLQEILFDELKLPVIVKTPTGQPSTAEAVLQELAYEYRLPAVILEYRTLTKLVTTYIDALPKCIHPVTGRVHTNYNQAVTATGRLSSSDPNLQNIPIRSEEGRLIRTAFIAAPGFQILAADYSQIELRIMAHLSQDPNLLKAFAHDWDIHSATASEIFQVPLEEVTQEQRRRTKAVNFGLIYGMSAFGLAKQLGIERQDAQYYMDRYFQRYPGVLDYMERTRRLAHQQGYVETILGRRLYLPEINSGNLMRQRAAERIAINAPMQGTAADIIKLAMLAIHKWCKEMQFGSEIKMIMQVHDELVFEMKQELISTIQKKIADLMENVLPLSVPLKVSIGYGKNWGESH